MLVRYFLKQFYFHFLIFFICFILIFASGDVLLRLAVLPSFFTIPFVFYYMLPTIMLYAIPLASSMAVLIPLGTLFNQNELLLFRFLHKARLKLYFALLCFGASLALCFTPLVLHLAPKSYWRAKHYLVNSVKEQFAHLQPRKFHTLLPFFTFFFKTKEIQKEGAFPVFHDVLLLVKDHDSSYLITARTCFLRDTKLIVVKGTLQNYMHDKWYVGEFEETELDLNRLLVSDKKDSLKLNKFLTVAELRRKSDNKAWVELHKRIVQILWILVIPCISFWLFIFACTYKSSLFISILISGGLFLYSLISMNTALASSQNYSVALLLLYASCIFAIALSYLVYKRKWP